MRSLLPRDRTTTTVVLIVKQYSSSLRSFSITEYEELKLATEVLHWLHMFVASRR